MAFSNVSQQVFDVAGYPIPPGSVTDALAAIERAYRPLRLYALINNATGVGGSFAIPVNGRNLFELVLYETPGGAAPSGEHVQLWGCHFNVPGSWYQIGTDITALGSTQFTTSMPSYVVVYVSALVSGNLNVDFSAMRSG